MRTLIAIVNAQHRKEWRDAIRTTWLCKVPSDKADAFFFVGRGEGIEDTEGVVQLECSDKYEHLPEKIKTIAKWALEHGYTHMLKCDDDVVLRPQDFLSSGYDKYDYTGRSNRPESPYAIPCGFNYCLSARSMEIVSTALLPPDGSNDDEKWVAYHLSLKDIKLQDDKRYFLWQFVIPLGDARRPLRAPRRPVVAQGIQQESGTFSWCIHVLSGQDKVNEYHRVYRWYGK